MLCIVGGGRMGTALLEGLMKAGWAPADLAVAEHNEQYRQALVNAHPGLTVLANPVPSDAVLLAVKPHDVEAACWRITDAGTKRVLSVAAGITLHQLEQWLGGHLPIVRAMPNAAATVDAAASAIAGGSKTTEADLVWAEEILGAIGLVVRVPEHQLDAVTGLSGSGLAYLALVVEALVDGGVLAGLSRTVAEQLMIQTLRGAGQLLADHTPLNLRSEVTTPAGTTAAGLRVLEQRAVRAAFIDAVAAAAQRSHELGQTTSTH